jgi:hypothetical protein
MYFANDGGIYRALDGFTGLKWGACMGTNQVDSLNQKLGSLTQFVAFSQHPTDPKILLRRNPGQRVTCNGIGYGLNRVAECE